jgi:hypothetical protein
MLYSSQFDYLIYSTSALNGFFNGVFLEDGKEGWEEGEFDTGDGLEAQETVFDLGDELEVGHLVGGGGIEGDVGDLPLGDARDVEAGGGGVVGEGCGLNEACVNDVALSGGVAVAEGGEEVHGQGRVFRVGAGCGFEEGFGQL